MNRRRFLSLLGLAAPAMALDPERALWVPGQKTVFDLGATPRGIELADYAEVAFDYHANTFVTPEWVMEEIAQRLVKDLSFMRQINRDYSDVAPWTVEGEKVGTTVGVRLPVHYALNPSKT